MNWLRCYILDTKAWLIGGHEIQEGNKRGRVFKEGHITDISKLKHYFCIKTKNGVIME